MNRIRWFIFALICAVIFGILIATNQKPESSFSGDASKVITDGPVQDHVYGSADQKVVLIEYGDFQCPACAGIYPSLTALKAQYKDKLTFIFRHYPLTDKHPNALAAATAAEAAGRQGKFYEMHDQLYQLQSSWTNAELKQRDQVFEQYASAIGLNIEQYKKDLTSSDIMAKINRDRTTGRKNFSVDGTPTFVLNGHKLDSQTGLNADKLKQAVEEELKKAVY